MSTRSDMSVQRQKCPKGLVVALTCCPNRLTALPPTPERGLGLSPQPMSKTSVPQWLVCRGVG